MSKRIGAGIQTKRSLFAERLSSCSLALTKENYIMSDSKKDKIRRQNREEKKPNNENLLSNRAD